MKLLFDFFPILLFFIAFKLYGIYIATAVAIGACVIQVGSFWLKFRRFETMQLVTLGCVAVLGGATILLHDELFIKWKPSVLYWAFGVIFIGTHYLSKKTLLQRLMDHKVTLPLQVWYRLNFSWAVFFILLGFLNLYVVYNYSTDAWVNFKLFGTLGLTLAFVILQSLYMSRHVDQDQLKEVTK